MDETRSLAAGDKFFCDVHPRQGGIRGTGCGVDGAVLSSIVVLLSSIVALPAELVNDDELLPVHSLVQGSVTTSGIFLILFL